MNNRFIAFHGIGEIYVDPFKMAWSKFDSSLLDRKKELPLFQLALDLASLLYTYKRKLMREYFFGACFYWYQLTFVQSPILCNNSFNFSNTFNFSNNNIFCIWPSFLSTLPCGVILWAVMDVLSTKDLKLTGINLKLATVRHVFCFCCFSI